MKGAQRRISSAVDKRVASAESDIRFGRCYGHRPRLIFSGEQDVLAAVLRWEYCDYAKWLAGWFERQCLAEMEFDRNNSVVYDQNRCAQDTAVGAYIWPWKALERTCAEIFVRFSIRTYRLYVIATRGSTFACCRSSDKPIRGLIETLILII